MASSLVGSTLCEHAPVLSFIHLFLSILHHQLGALLALYNLAIVRKKEKSTYGSNCKTENLGRVTEV